MRFALASVRYRVGQVLRGFRPALHAHEADEVRRLLSDGELQLFLPLDARDRRQAVDVMRWLLQRTEPSTDLLAAALLHDVGKRGIRLRDRVAFVLLEAVSPRLVDRLGAERDARWRRALWTLRHHARLGADLLAGAGTRPRVVALVADHTGAAGDDAELGWLIAADDAC